MRILPDTQISALLGESCVTLTSRFPMEQRIPTELPLLTRFVNKFGDSKLFEDTNVIFAQHFVGDFISLLRAMLRTGIRKDLSWFLDIPYAANKAVREAIVDLGFPETNFAPDIALGALDPYESTQYFRTVNLFSLAMKEGIKKGTKRTIIIDDGGHTSLARHVIEAFAFPKKHSVTVVEQTRHGIRLHRTYRVTEKIRVINVADSRAKLKYETPVIARSAITRMKQLMEEENLELRPQDRILIIGYGNVGKAVTQSLINDSNILESQITVKPNPQEQYFMLRDGQLCQTPVRELLSKHRLVLGCSGERAFQHSHLPLLGKDCMLASVSSWALEFPKDDWVAASQSPRQKNVRLTNHNAQDLSNDVHKSLHFILDGQTVILANAGYPINFWGGINTSPPESMQLTVSLMVAGVIQALKDNYSVGEYSLDASIEDWIVKAFQDIQGEPVIYMRG